jgi:hypothetical protein
VATAVKNAAHIAGLSNSEVDVPNLVIAIKHLHFGGIWLCVTPRSDTKKDMFKRDWIACSKYDNHSRFNSHDN